MPIGQISEFNLNGGSSWKTYIERLQQYFVVNEVKETLHVPTLISCVGDDTYELMVDLCNPEKPAGLKFDKLVDLVAKHVEPTPSILAERYKFRKRVQTSGESVAQFSAALKHLAKTCDFKTNLEENLRDQFVCGLSSEVVRQRLFLEEKLDYGQAFRKAVALEAAASDAASVEHQGHNSRMEEHMVQAIKSTNFRHGGAGGPRQQYGGGGSGGGATNQRAEGKGATGENERGRGVIGKMFPRGSGGGASSHNLPCSCCGSKDHGTLGCKFKNYVCKVCLKEGHLKKVCPSKMAYNSKKVFHIDNTFTENCTPNNDYDYESDNDDGPCGLYMVDSSDKEPITKIVEVEGIHVEMHVDTGSPISCIGDKLYNKYFKNLELLPKKVALKGYNGEPIYALGVIIVRVTCNLINKTLELYVIKNGGVPLLGRAWLRQLQINVLMSESDNIGQQIEPRVHSGEITNLQVGSAFSLDKFVNKYPTVFSGKLGLYRGAQATLRLRADAAPVYRRARPLPLALRPLVDAELARMEQTVPLTQVVGVAGEPVYLPCDISTQDDDDAVLLVLWYKEDLGTPIYSVDARERDFGVAERWSDESVFASRAYFLPDKRPAELGVDRVKASDQGIYRCRVDFKQAQTRNSRINLTVIVPPSRMIITDDRGDTKQAIVGPYLEGDAFSLKCDVTGGRPRPWVKWFRDEVEQDTPATPLQDGAVRGVIHVGPLTRKDVRSTFTCRASNHARSHPMETTLTLDMNFPPLSIHILGSNQPLSASRRYDLLCQSSGSRPPASITWWKNGQRINNAKETLSTDGNTTTSTVSLQLNKLDAGAKLACRASNPQMPSVPPLEDGWTLDIQYVPETVVRLGTNLDNRNIREGSDVYFDCVINAHPYVYKVEWRHNGKTLQHNVGHGIIISNQSLVLQGVGRKTAGNYTCVGFNAEGDGESKPFNLNVLYAPTCKTAQQRDRVHGIAKQERAHITCHVDANPPEVAFRWTFNNTANSNEVSETYVTRAGTSSTVTYTPHTEMDYGTLLCWASNAIGKQKVPCVYHIIAAGRPDPVHNCTVVNASMTSFGVRCMDGFNGGMPQSFLLEVRDIVTQEIVANISLPISKFTAVGLEPGKAYSAAVIAYNAKGRAEPYPVRASTLSPPEKHHVHDKSLDIPRKAFQISGTMSAVVGGGGIFAIILVLFMIMLKNKCSRRKPRPAPPLSSQGSPDKLREKDDSESDDRNPDIIPSDTDQMQMEYYRQQHVSTITPPGGRGGRGSVAGVRGGLPAYCALRTGPPPSQPLLSDHNNSHNSIPPPARFASGSCTLPRGTTITSGSIPLDARCGIPLQHLRTLPRPIHNPSSTFAPLPRDTPL